MLKAIVIGMVSMAGFFAALMMIAIAIGLLSTFSVKLLGLNPRIEPLFFIAYLAILAGGVTGAMLHNKE